MVNCGFNNETWQVIPFAPDYEASSLGRIRRCVPDKCGRPMRILKPSKPNRYAKVGLFVEKKLTTQLVHRCVAWAFHGAPPSDKHHAAHIDGDCDNNRPENLRWATARENILDKAIHGTQTAGEAHPCAKLNTALVRLLRERHAAGISYSQLARELDMHVTTIRDAVIGVKWKSVT